jgi:UDP-N-acetylmuramate dehydrogenase
MQRLKNYSLLHDNTFGIDQRCEEYIVYSNATEAADVARELHAGDKPFLLLGGGSNLLLTKDFQGRVVTPEKRFDISVILQQGSNEPALRCWAGTTFDDVVDYAVRHGYHGLENLSLIPGECGASAVQNIGAYGAEIKDVITTIEAVEIATGRVVTIHAQDCGYAYRESRFKHEWKNRYLITYVTYQLSRKFHPELDYGNVRKQLEEIGISEASLTGQQLRDTIIGIRQAKLPDPAITGNAGSFFMNPIVDEATFKRLKAEHPDLRYFEVKADEANIPHESSDHALYYKIPAGWMIDKCGWKGKQLGRAGVHEKQALILVNKGGATGQEIVDLMQAIQKDVKKNFGLEIRPEVNII